MSDKICPFFYGTSVPGISSECLEDKCALWCDGLGKCRFAVMPVDPVLSEYMKAFSSMPARKKKVISSLTEESE